MVKWSCFIDVHYIYNRNYAILFLNNLPWSSYRDPQRNFGLPAFWPCDSPYIFGVGPQRDVPIGLYLLDPMLPLAMQGSRWPSYADHYCLEWSNYGSSYWLFGLLMSMASAPVSYSSHESSVASSCHVLKNMQTRA